MSDTPSELITIVLADDHSVTRAGIHKTLESIPDFKIIGEAENGDQAQALVAQLHPNILVLDLVMPNTKPAELERQLREKYPETNTLVLTGHDRAAYLSDMIEAGASGCLDKNVKKENLIAAIRRTARGEIIFDEEQLTRAHEWRVNVKQKWDSLSEREREVLQLLGESANNQAIAQKLSLAPKTIEKHLIHLYEKLGVSNRMEAALWWERNGRDFPH
jgi:two-component system, NarL family, response regulator LiaR